MATTEIQSAQGKSLARVSIQDGFVWDAQDAYLFDIDGTILRSRDRIHFNSFASSVRQVTGLEISLEGMVLHGGTDTAILREAFAQAGIAVDAWESQNEAILEAMRQTIETRRADLDMWRMPGIEETLRHLAERGALLGLATGNLEMIGWTKVELVGLREWFRFGGFSDKFEVRSEMIRDAVFKAREIAGPNVSPCVVGDTPRDIEAARANSLPVIAVATGNYGFDELAEMKPEVCTTSLADLLAETNVRAAVQP
ncbi:HAD family hydrolase [Acidicapsa ligni]|uniref:HAD family hydrolase n=1 Tax=Acidicapsa ligni TaxID=542300 RepID=UPI0021E0A41C|nr:HAD family hydrolase [Acidicapsa ligni]